MTTFNNMNISSPAVDSATYNTTVDDAFQKIDEHDHTSGKGVQIPTAGIEDNAITGAKLNSAIVDDSTIEINSNTLQVKDGGIDTTQLADGSVETAKIADDSVTTAKMAINYALSSGIANDAITSTSAVFIQNSGSTDLSATITLEGDRDLELSLINIQDGSFDPEIAATVALTANLKFNDGSTDYRAAEIQYDGASSVSPASIRVLIPAGTYSAGAQTFKISAEVSTGQLLCYGFKIMAREL